MLCVLIPLGWLILATIEPTTADTLAFAFLLAFVYAVTQQRRRRYTNLRRHLAALDDITP